VPEASVKAYAAALHEPGGRYALRETARQIVPDDVDELTAAYPTIEAPTLIIWGRHDEIVPLSVGERLHAAIPHSRLVIVENAGHAPHEETSEQVRAILEQFFR
jgi:pimeloyl-ACP methyl ester carboxylesterase